MEGWIKWHRKVLDNPIIMKDKDYFAVWGYLLLNATHKEYDVLFNGKRISLKEGQLIIGRKSIAEKLKIDESKVQRILKSFENEQQIEQQTTSRNRLISIINWHEYQQNEQQIEQQVNNDCTTNEQQVNTNKNIKNNKNEKNISKKESKESFDDLIDKFTQNEELRIELRNHLATRKAKRATLTNRAIELSLKNLTQLADSDEEKIKIVQQSIEKGWTSFYRLENKKKTNKQNEQEYNKATTKNWDEMYDN